MIAIRMMTGRDVPLGMRLKQQAGWNQREADWQRLLDLQPDGCFVAECDGAPAGTVATCVFGSVAWVAMVLVDESLRGRGIGRALMDYALEFLDRRGVASIRLDATPLGQPLYEKLGFVGQFSIVRYAGSARATTQETQTLLPDDSQIDELIALDRRLTNTDRERLLTRFAAEFPDALRVVVEKHQVTGYLTSRPGSHAVQIGPGVALDAASGERLLRDALRRYVGDNVYLDLPESNLAAIDIAQEPGLTAQRRLLRMCRGVQVCEDISCLWASSGPEKG